ncbi:hypothetical protein Q4E93_19085 [Flavitalea sp. BT771]|uniref:hypothetical protein n=1 Tax=Flavitalea sp. BT771 TaxID=3063329 RepID=UPI0026E18477|nr:hypothetical protein [Flavitalea sp. BT771]MDO6432719.1 hypothetical protein [Flavitalea sp. BT771]MDV6222005.1 hypothetical protein [Flavitalea sp. BT771]
MSPDSLDIYGQSISGHYGDWHPPLMAWFWSLANKLYQGPQVMLLFQLALLWASFYFLATGWFSSRRSRIWLFLGFLLAPFVQNFAGYIIKDAQLALSWLAGVSIIARAASKDRRMTLAEAVFSFLFILYGTVVRINALPGAIPLFYLWVDQSFPWKRARFWRAGAVLLLLLSAIGCHSLLNYILKPQKQYPEYKLYLHDMAGVYVRTGENYFPTFINSYPGFDTVYLRSNYTTATFDDLYWNQEKKISFLALNDSTSHIIRKAWVQSISNNFGDYLYNRWDGFLYFLRIKKRTWIVTLNAVVPPNNFGITFKPNFVSRAFIWLIKLQSGAPYMRPWCWLLLNVSIFIAGFYIYNASIRKIVFVLASSSLLYMLSQFFIFQVDTEFRYFYWNCLSLFICIFYLIKDWQLKKNASLPSFL